LYQSLHTTVIGPDGKIVEVQIRTKDMNETAEYGMAAHWAYKFNTKKEELEKNMDWLKVINKMQKDIPNSSEFLEFLHKSLLPDDYHAFTPDGKRINMPFGATILDFAFAIHTDLGLHCLVARVANDVLGIESPIPLGETIQILQSESQEPLESWLAIAKTPKAQTAIKQWLRKSMASSFEVLGKKIWQRELLVLKIPANKVPQEGVVCKFFSSPSMSSFYENLGRGDISLQKVLAFLKRSTENDTIFSISGILGIFSASDNTPIILDQNERLLLNYAKCCNPLPGDKVKGLIKHGKGIEIHKTDCKILNNYPEEHCLDLRWDSQNSSEHKFKCIFRVESIDRICMEEDILAAISRNNVRIKKTIFETMEDKIKGKIEVLALSQYQIGNIERSLNAVVGVRKVTRT
jgi:GTP pyrophosphokinase